MWAPQSCGQRGDPVDVRWRTTAAPVYRGTAALNGAGGPTAAVCPACGAHRPPALPQPLADAVPRNRSLTPRERVVLQYLGLGYDNRSIAREMNISERTVKRFVTAILAKLGLRSRLQAGLFALMVASSPVDGALWPEGLMDGVRAGDDDDLAHETGGDHDLRRPRRPAASG
ncbi:helix-turn-helix domain-containing protein [Kitasatospora sp. NBC_00458]|uniref:helix-turn-helix domain-containing protein n=1 Tax=Kitasatospora sp. NBC_00458 TaxID=2903568 RepID=UPI002E16E315